MDAVICALRLAEAATESLSVPGLTNAVKVALRLAEMAKEIKDTKDDMRSLAEHAARTTQAIFDTIRSFEGPIDVSRTDERLDGLLSTLQRVEDVMSRTGKKRWISVILHKNDYKAELAKLEKELDQALEIFHVQGSISTDNQLSSVRHTQVELLHRADDAQRVDSELLRHAHDTHTHLVKLSDQAAGNATHDGTMRLFGRDDLELIEELDPESPVDASGAQPVRYKARLRSDNSLVVVRRFPRLDARFRDEVEVGKSIWHPNVAHAIGYSKSDPYTAFIVVDGFHTRTFNELCMTFHGPDKLKWMLKAVSVLAAGLAYLASLRDDLGWTPDEKVRYMWPLQAERELLVSVDGRVLLDPSCYRLEHLPNTIIHDDGVRLCHMVLRVASAHNDHRR
ncbi:hypothetical protein K466DRAFT_500181 [Polyporus arcularius HHB13444]|uniref:Protein kinase domain-containing protein n=1 Tax=Polyporus arcularius HHB13444 TaxID=1314778 RepID=A0A5C3P1M2_9APHY|nr:hypothetical protein K466DRAFT_500181 [Polyporus arcularius HHB13444]